MKVPLERFVLTAYSQYLKWSLVRIANTLYLPAPWVLIFAYSNRLTHKHLTVKNW